MIRVFKNIFHFSTALIWSLVYKFPGKKMIVIGVTGTDGKTTTTNLIYHILTNAGKKVSMISTIAAKINGKSYDTGLHVTTPSPFLLQKYLRKALDDGCEYFVLEVTSHALDQFRTFGTSIDLAVITNISHEHLDYHRTFDNYRDAKAKILKKAKYAILNVDDGNYSYLSKRTKAKIITFGIKNKADFNLDNFPLKTNLAGDFNLYNCLAAAAAAATVEIPKEKILKALSTFKGLDGRMEETKTKRPFRIFIDFAHKPNALENVLKSARKLTSSKLIVIFGCAGLRDKLKRPMMGEISAKLADYIILTAEDPRTEDVRQIINEIAVGCQKLKINEADKKNKDSLQLKKNEKYFWRIPDRQEAINFGIKYLGKNGDMILICGKGHEKSMCYGKIEYPWDEKKAIEKALYAAV